MRYLQITVPADIYSSGIICEASGIHLHLRLLDDTRKDRTRPEADEHVLPTTTDLAKSFLQTEPEEEKDELQAAISSQSQVLPSRSQVLQQSSTEDDDDDELGLGDDSLSLPSFVAAFLKGVADRLQVTISDIAVRIDTELKQDGPSKRQPETDPDLVSAVLNVREIKVDGVSSDPDSEVSLGKRLLSLSDINLALVSDPVVFSNYSRFASPSPVMTQSKSSQPLSRAPSPSSPPSNDQDNLAMTQSTILEPPQQHTEDSLNEEILYQSLGEPSYRTLGPAQHMEHSTYTHDGRFSDADSDTKSDGYLQDSQNLADDDILDNPAYLDSVIEQGDDDDVEDNVSYPFSGRLVGSNEGTPRPLSPLRRTIQHLPRSNPEDTRSQLYGHASDPAAARPEPEPMRQSIHGDSHEHSHEQRESTPSEASTDSSNEELSESRIFGHEEAQSMYMSAMSKGSSDMPAMPGAWDSESVFQEPHAPEQLEEAPTPKLTGQSQPLSQTQQPTVEETHLDPLEYEPDENPPLEEDIGQFTSVAKRFFTVDKVRLWIPSAGQAEDSEDDHVPATPQRPSVDLKDSTAHLQQSRFDDFPTSSIYASTRFRSGSTAEATAPRPVTHDKQAIAVDVSSVELRLDIATGWLLTKMGQRVSHTFGGSDDGKPHNPRKKSHHHHQSRESENRHALTLSLGQLSIKFVEHLHGSAYNLDGEPLQLRPSSPSLDSSVEDIVLRVTASGLQSSFATDHETTDLRLDVSKFAFGFASEDLISFDESLKMRESTRDILAPTHGDVSFSLSKSHDAAKIDLTTQPLQINLNVLRLEEVFGFLGGLSTILEVGSSISSVSTLRGGKPDAPKKQKPKQKPRGVHFETAPPPASVQSDDSTSWKVNARVGGIVLDLVGESHYLKLRSTALKLVSRSEGVGVQIDKAKLSGPFALNNKSSDDGDDDDDTPPAKFTLSNIRVEYLFSPKEVDLDRLLALITPSKDKYDEDDDIMLDTLFRQRRQGSVLRVTVSGTKAVISRTKDLDSISQLASEVGRISSVAKYLPEDDRPGLLTLVLVKELDCRVHVGGHVGEISARLQNAEAANISIPSLVAAQIGTIGVVRNGDEELAGEVLPLSKEYQQNQKQQKEPPLPVLLARFIADEMEPAVKVKLHNLRVEYTIPSIMAFLGIDVEMSRGDVANNMAQSVANLAEPPTSPEHVKRARRMSEKSSSTTGDGDGSGSSTNPREPGKPVRLAVDMRDCAIGLNPRSSPARGIIVLTNARFSGTIHDPESSEAKLDLRKASMMVIDDVQHVGNEESLYRARSTAPAQSNQVQSLIDLGYVPVSSISAATATVRVLQSSEDGSKSLDVEIRDDLLILESCADSTQTLISIMNGLQPPMPQSDAVKYRTEVVPIQDMLASFSGEDFTAQQAEPSSALHSQDDGHVNRGGIDDELEYVSDFYPAKPTGTDDGFVEMSASQTPSDSNELLDSFHSQYQVSSSFSELDFQSDHFAKQSAVGGTAHRWDSTQNTYGLSNDSKIHRSPLRIRVRDAHVIWNLFDGYDWQRTRDTISKAVKDVEKKASRRTSGGAGGAGGSRMSPGFEDEEESVIGDCLFNSIYIGIPANKDPRDIRTDINRNIDDIVSETGSYATTTTATATASRPSHSPSLRGKKLRLSRSKYHKMTFELKGICADFVVFPPDSGETQSSLDVRVNDLEIFDHVPTSTWKKFATYMHEAGEKESGTSMIHLEILTVRPVPELAASEIVLKATVLPLRLHVDQDALDFLCRFFEFRDESDPSSSSSPSASAQESPSEVPFLQRAEVNSVAVKLDFKPKRVDYAGLRSGRTTEFMNFFVLDNADMVLRHVIIYGISGFDKLGQTLNDIWMPDVKRNQLPGVLAGLAPIRSLVNVGGGVKDLVVVPMREYQKDGRIVRSIQRGAISFAKTTSNELVKLGAKLAIGTQTVLQGAEDLLVAPNAAAAAASPSSATAGTAAATDLASPATTIAATTPASAAAAAAALNDDDLIEDEDAKRISLYADQPVGVVQGLRGAYTGLERDLLLARDAIVAVPGEVVESGSAKAAAKAVWKRAPTVVLRPAIGVSKAVGQTLLGAGNTLDPANRRKMEDVSSFHSPLSPQSFLFFLMAVN